MALNLQRLTGNGTHLMEENTEALLVIVPLTIMSLRRFEARTSESIRKIAFLTLGALALALHAFAQEDVPLFKAEAKSAFVWGEDSTSGAISFVVKDPLTGSEVLKLRHGQIEVSSQMGFEKRKGQLQEFIAYTTTVVNNSENNLAVKYGGTTIDGHIVLPLSVFSNSEAHRKRIHTDPNRVEVETMYCFSSGFLARENFFPLDPRLGTLTVKAQKSITISGVVKDPRPSPILCSVNGCSPKGTIGFSIQVGSQDFIFVRPGRSLADCGK